jgi:hypothetical protein
MFLVDNRLLDLAFWSNVRICLLIGKLSPFTFRILIEKYLQIPVFCYLFFPQVESHVDCSLLLAWFILRFCWFTVFFMLATFLAVMKERNKTHFPLWVLFFPDLSCLSLFFILFHVKYAFKYPFNADMVNMNHISLSLSWKVLISP